MFKATFTFLSLISPPTKRFSILIISAFLLLLTSACNFSVTQQKSGLNIPENTVDVLIQPKGVKPLVFLGEGGRKICRRGLPDEKVYDLKPEETKEEEEQTEEGAEQSSNATTATHIISTEVGDNWFQMGLLIVNKSNSYHLIIEQLVFVISAPWGDELLIRRANISSGYCNSSPLYIIRPTPKNATNQYVGYLYQPLKKNYQNNLTLFVSGVPIPEGPPTRKKENNNGPDALNDIRATAQQSIGNIPKAPDEFVLTYLPPYKVQLLMFGYWTDRDRNRVANFAKKINVSLSSQFLD